MTKNAIIQLNNELAELRKFVALLTSEQLLLTDNDTEGLLTLSEIKTQAANQLMAMSKSRRQALLTGDTANMEAWIDKNAPNSKTLWDEIRKLAAEAQNLNNINGELIQSKMRYNQQALGVLYNSSKNAASLYGPDGQANIKNAGRHLGSG